MMNWYNPYYANVWMVPWAPLLVLLVAIDIILRGMALWKSARNGQMYWFVALLVINLVGILPLIYLLWFAKKLKKR